MKEAAGLRIMTEKTVTFLRRACAYGAGDIGANGSFYIIGV
jgi:hypothetical protein